MGSLVVPKSGAVQVEEQRAVLGFQESLGPGVDQEESREQVLEPVVFLVLQQAGAGQAGVVVLAVAKEHLAVQGRVAVVGLAGEGPQAVAGVLLEHDQVGQVGPQQAVELEPAAPDAAGDKAAQEQVVYQG